MTDAIVADDVESTEGAGIVDTVRKLSSAISDQEPWTAVAEGASGGLELLGTITDPFGSLLSAGIGWVIDHCEPLRIPLDALAGDPRAIDSASQDWLTRSERLQITAQDIRRQAKEETADWEGAAGNAYRKAADALADHAEGMSEGATGVAGGIRNAGVLVTTIRGIIRDLIADFVSAAIIKLAVSMGLSFVTAGVSLGAGITWLIGKVGITVGKITQKLSDVVSKLSDMLGNLGRLSSALTEVGNRASRLVATGAAHLDTAASSVGSSRGVRNMFNGSVQGATDRGVAHAENFTSPSSFNYNVSSGSLDGASNITGDAIKAGNEANKNAAQAAEQWETDQTTAQSRAAQWKAHQ